MPKNVVNARKRAKPSTGQRQKAALMRNAITSETKKYYDKYIKLGVAKDRIATVIQSAGAKKLWVEILATEKPPRVVLPKAKKRGEMKLNDKLANEICEQLQRGASLALVASWVGIAGHTLSDWLRRKGEPYATFQTAVSQSLAYAEMNMINCIAIGCYNDPQLALKWMQMRYPEKYMPNPQAPPGTSITFDLGGFLQEVLAEREGADRVKALRAARQEARILDVPAEDVTTVEAEKVQ